MKIWCMRLQLFQAYYLSSRRFNTTILAMEDRSPDLWLTSQWRSHLHHHATTITDHSFHPFIILRNSSAHSHARYCRAEDKVSPSEPRLPH